MGRVIFFLLIVAIVAMCEVNADAKSKRTCSPRTEVYTECGSACPPTCDEPVPQGACIQVCIKGCFCKEGFIRDTRSGYCVRPNDCRRYYPGNWGW